MSFPECTDMAKLHILASNRRLIPQQRGYVIFTVVTPDPYQIHTMNFTCFILQCPKRRYDAIFWYNFKNKWSKMDRWGKKFKLTTDFKKPRTQVTSGQGMTDHRHCKDTIIFRNYFMTSLLAAGPLITSWAAA